MGDRRKRPPLLASLSVQFPCEQETAPSRDKIFRRRRFSKKDSFQSSFASPKEDEEFLLPNQNPQLRETSWQNGGEDVDKITTNGTGAEVHFECDEASCSKIVRAILDDDLEELSRRLEAGDEVEEEDERGFKPIHYACKHGRVEAVKKLINYGCDKLATISKDRVTSLHLAVRAEQISVISLLLAEGVMPDVREKKHGRTPVHEATLSGNPRILKVLTESLIEDPWEAQRILRIGDKNGQTALHIAACNNLPTEVGLLLAAGADVSSVDQDGLTPMHLCLISHRGKRRCGGLLTQLLEAGGDVEAEGGEDRERLSHLAARAGCSVCLRFLSDRGGDMMAKDKYGRTPLHTAALEGNCDAAKFLASKVELELFDDRGQRPLHYAILSDTPSTIEALLEAGADSSASDTDGRSFIQLAILRRKINAFKALVKSKVTEVPQDSGEDLIHYCSALGFMNCVQFLLDNGWDLNLKDKKGRTALHRALNHGHEDLATMLINEGASLHETDNAGATPLHYAVRWGGSDAILRLLVKKKAQLGVRDHLGRTPLHYAASKFSIMSDLYILLGGGSALDSQDQMGLTPLHLAARLGNESLVRILLENGAKHNLKDIDNFLPIDHAIEKDNKSIIKRLQSHDLDETLDHEPVSRTKDEKLRLSQQRKSVNW